MKLNTYKITIKEVFVIMNYLQSARCLFFIFLSTLVISCESKLEPTGPIPKDSLYQFEGREQLKQANTNFQAAVDDKDRDPDFNYTPGVIQKVDPTRIILTEEDPAATVDREFIIFCTQEVTPDILLKRLKKKKIESRIVGYIPTYNIIQLEVNNDSEEIAEQIRNLSGVIQLHRSRVRKVESGAFVERISSLVDDRFWHLKSFDIPEIWKHGTGQGIRVAVIDSGIESDLEDFAYRIQSPWSVVTQSTRFEDHIITAKGNSSRVISHGTMVASLICGNNSKQRRVTGTAPNANIIPIQVIGYSPYKD